MDVYALVTDLTTFIHELQQLYQAFLAAFTSGLGPGGSGSGGSGSGSGGSGGGGPAPARLNTMRVQLQQQAGAGNRITHQGIALVDNTGGGVTTAQVITALATLLTNPVIPNKLRSDAAQANARAVKYVLSFPPNGIYGVVKRSFYFGFKDSSHNWSFDIDNLVGHNLKV